MTTDFEILLPDESMVLAIPADPPLVSAARRDRRRRCIGRDGLAEDPDRGHTASEIRRAGAQPCDHLLPGEPLVRPLLWLRAASSSGRLRASPGLLAAGWQGWQRRPIRVHELVDARHRPCVVGRAQRVEQRRDERFHDDGRDQRDGLLHGGRAAVQTELPVSMPGRRSHACRSWTDRRSGCRFRFLARPTAARSGFPSAPAAPRRSQ